MDMNSYIMIKHKFILKGKVAIVTGGPGLHGKEFYRTLAEAGATVVITDIDTDGVNTLATINGRESCSS
jgi:NAD(P)-dependent dehydrogenase (short-subunit alcohol dehydrogenase family)